MTTPYRYPLRIVYPEAGDHHTTASTVHSDNRLSVCVKEAARLVDCSEREIRRAVDRGDLRIVRLGTGRNYRVTMQSLRDWVGV